MRQVVIVSATRSPIGKIRGGLSTIRPDDLAAQAIEEAIARANIDGSNVDEVIFGCANQAGEDNRNVARMATVLAGSRKANHNNETHPCPCVLLSLEVSNFGAFFDGDNDGLEAIILTALL